MVVSRLRGGQFDERPTTPRLHASLGRFRYWGCRRCEPVCDGTCFPCGMFSHCASNADYLYVNTTESLAENVASPLAVGWLTQGSSRGSRTVTQVWFGIAVATVLADSPFETTRESFPDSRFPPRKPRDSARSHTWCDSDTGSRRQVGNMPYLGIGSISGIMHIIARLPRAARAVVVVAVLIAIWR